MAAQRIIVVDDVEINRAVLCSILKNDYEVLEAAGGKEALDCLYKNIDDTVAIMLDLVMPEMDGYQVLETIRADSRLSKIPVIITTSYTEGNAEEKVLALGADDFVAKPYNAEVIRRRLQNVLALRKASSSIEGIQYDRLTGLLNRNTFFERVSELVATCEPKHYTISCFDINNFKVINDQYGTQIGDEVLKHISNCLREWQKGSNALCSHISADTFSVLSETAFLNSAEVENLQYDSEHPPCIDHPVKIRIGRYIIDDPALDISAMYDRAALAAKALKGQVNETLAYYNESMRVSILREQEVLDEVVPAIESKQFEIWFQPQYNHATGARVGAEALVRWRHPTRGLIPPNDFVPVLERTGLIYRLDRYVWEHTCKYVRAWEDQGLNPLPVSVNVSRYDLLQEDFLATIESLVKKHGLSKNMLRLEITESAFTDSNDIVINVVEELVKSGYTIEIDDFGSGYSSLNTLKDVPAQILKLDMRFLKGTRDTQRGGNIVESIVRMAKWLSMPVIAEGVETKEQADFLKSVGCFYIQGYYYAKPIPADEYQEIVEHGDKERDMVALETVENLDNNSFWNPESMDTLIFNSYVGGACIFEYRNGSIELMRATDKYAQVIGSAGMTVEDALKLDWSNHLDNEDAIKVIDSLEKSIETGDEVTTDYKFLNLPGCPEITYLRSTLRVIARADDRYLVYCTNENITKHKLAEQALENERLKTDELSQQMAELMNDTPGGFVRMEVVSEYQVKLVYANDGYCRLRKMSREELIDAYPRDAFAYIHPEDKPYVKTGLAEAVDNLETRTFKCRLRDTFGNYTWLKMFARASKNEAGRRYLNLYYSDLSEKEATLQQAMPLLLDAIMESSTDLSFSKNKDFVYLRCSRAFSNMVGLDSPKEIVGKTDYDIFEKDVADKYRSDDEELIKNGVSIIDKLEPIPSDDGKPHYSMTSKYILKDTDGDILGLYGVGRDVTENREAFSKLRLLTETIPGGIATYTLSNEGIRLTYFNDGYCDLFGYTREEYTQISKDNVISLVFEEDVPALQERIIILKSEGKPLRHTYRVHHKDGGYRWIALNASPSDRKGDLIVAQAVLVDITDQKKAELKVEADRRNLLENLPCGAAIYEVKDGKITARFINRRYMKLVGRGIPGQEFASVMESVHPDDRGMLDAEVKLAIQEKRDVEIILRVLHGSGRYIQFSVTGHMEEQVGDTTVFYATYVPLEKGSASYQEILPTALSAMLESANDIVFVKDVNSVYICGSRAFADFVGIDELEKIVGKTDYELFSKEYADEYLQNDRVILETGEPQIDYLSEYTLSRGSKRFLRTSKYPLRDSNGRVVGIYGVGRDITEEQQDSNQLNLLMNNLPCGIASYEIRPASLRLLLCNDGYIELTGYSREEYIELIEQDPFAIVFEQDKRILIEAFKELFENHQPAGHVYRIIAKDKTTHWFSIKIEPSEILDDAVLANIVKFDVSELMRTTEALRMSESMLRMVVAHSNRITYRYDLVTKEAVSVAPEAALAAGFPEYVKSMPESLIEDGIIVEEDAEYVRELFRTARTRPVDDSMRFRARTSNGAIIWLDVDYTFVRDEDGKPVAAVVSCTDITKQHNDAQLTDVMRRRAEMDGMTGLYNKTTVSLLVNKHLSENPGERCALLIADLDNFKTINDTLGHDQGDRAIMMITQLIQTHFRQTDISGRVGGDEFVVFLKRCGDEEWLEKTMSILMERQRELYIGPNNDLPVRCSFGIAFGTSDNDTYDTLFWQADRALYHVKRNGKHDFALYVPQMNDDFYAYSSRLTKLSVEKKPNMSMHEAWVLVTQLRLITDTVRIVNAETMETYAFDTHGDLKADEHACHSVWGRNNRCENCISKQAVETRGMTSKDEILEGATYHCIALYIEIDRQPYVLELVSEKKADIHLKTQVARRVDHTSAQAMTSAIEPQAS